MRRTILAALAMTACATAAHAAVLHCVIPGGTQHWRKFETWIHDSDFTLTTEQGASPDWRLRSIGGLISGVGLDHSKAISQTDAAFHIDGAWPLPALLVHDKHISYRLTIDKQTLAAQIVERTQIGDDAALFRWTGACGVVG